MNKEMFKKRWEKWKIRSTHELKDEFGNVIERRFYNNDLELKSTNKYEYDKKNHLIKEIRYTKKQIYRHLIKFCYNDNGKLIERLSYDSDEKLCYKTIFEYSNNLCIVRRHYNGEDILRYKVMSYYDSNNNLIIQHSLNSKNEISSICIWDMNRELYEVIKPEKSCILKISQRNEDKSNPSAYMISKKYKTCSGIDE